MAMNGKQVILGGIAVVISMILLLVTGNELPTAWQSFAKTSAVVIAGVFSAIAIVGLWREPRNILRSALWLGATLLLAGVAMALGYKIWGLIFGFSPTTVLILSAIPAVLLVLTTASISSGSAKYVARIAFSAIAFFAIVWMLSQFNWREAVQQAEQQMEQARSTTTQVSTEEAEPTPESAQVTAPSMKITIIEWKTEAAEDGRPLIGVTGHFILMGLNEHIYDNTLSEGRFAYKSDPPDWEDGQRGVAILTAHGRHEVVVEFHYDAEAKQLVPTNRGDTFSLILEKESLDLSEESALVNDCASQECAMMMGTVYSLIMQGDPAASVQNCVADQPAKGDWLITTDANGSMGAMPFEESGQVGWKCTVSWLGDIYVLSNGQIVTSSQPFERDESSA